MNRVRWSALLAVCLLPALGCLSTTRSVMKTHPPAQVLSSTLDAIVKSTGDRDHAIKTLSASVDVIASVGGGKEGKVTEYTPFSAYILLRRPDDVRFIGMLPAIHTRMLDIVGDEKSFTLVIPPRSKVIMGSNVVSAPSQNPWENLRPSVFLDALTVHGADPDELVSLTSHDRIYQPDPSRKYVIAEPEYDLGILRAVPGSAELKTRRVIHIGRSNLLPYQQDTYNEKGQLVTETTYDNYKVYGDTTFPSHITIRRPLDGLSLALSVTKLSVNQALDDEQFQDEYPKTYQVQKLP